MGAGHATCINKPPEIKPFVFYYPKDYFDTLSNHPGKKCSKEYLVPEYLREEIHIICTLYHTKAEKSRKIITQGASDLKHG